MPAGRDAVLYDNFGPPCFARPHVASSYGRPDVLEASPASTTRSCSSRSRCCQEDGSLCLFLACLIWQLWTEWHRLWGRLFLPTSPLGALILCASLPPSEMLRSESFSWHFHQRCSSSPTKAVTWVALYPFKRHSYFLLDPNKDIPLIKSRALKKKK